MFECTTALQNRQRIHRVLLCIFIANAPDLDFLPGLLMGTPALYHQGVTHSFGFAFIVSLAMAMIYRLNGQSFGAIFGMCFLSYGSHLAIDFFGPDARPPLGQPLFWPISAEHVIAPRPVFWGVHHAHSTSTSTLQWVSSIVDLSNLWAVTLEIVLIGPYIYVARGWRKALLA